MKHCSLAKEHVAIVERSWRNGLGLHGTMCALARADAYPDRERVRLMFVEFADIAWGRA